MLSEADEMKTGREKPKREGSGLTGKSRKGKDRQRRGEKKSKRK